MILPSMTFNVSHLPSIEKNGPMSLEDADVTRIMIVAIATLLDLFRIGTDDEIRSSSFRATLQIR